MNKMNKKRIKAVVLLLTLILLFITGCTPVRISQSADNNEPYFVNVMSDYVKSGDIIYFANRNSGDYGKLRYLDTSTGESMPLCGKPDCLHNDEDCNASVNSRLGDLRLMLYNGRIYWLEGAIDVNGRVVSLFSMNTNGTDRKKVIELDSELFELASSHGSAEIHEDVLYICGNAAIVENTKPEVTSVVFAQPLNGGDAKLIYKSYIPANTVGRFCDDILYFMESERSYSAEGYEERSGPRITKLFAYNAKTGALEELCSEENDKLGYSYLLAADGKVYLGGYSNLSLFSVADKTLTSLDVEGKLSDPGDGVVLSINKTAPNQYHYSCRELENNSILSEGDFPTEAYEAHMLWGRYYIGCSDEKMYHRFEYETADGEYFEDCIFEIDVKSGESRQVWSEKTKINH